MRRWIVVSAAMVVASAGLAAPAGGLSGWHPISDYWPHEAIYRLGRMVGKRAHDVGSDEGYVGTAVLVGEDLVLTCGHVWHDIPYDQERPTEEDYEEAADVTGKGFTFNREKLADGSWATPDTYAATEVLYWDVWDGGGVDVSLVRVEGAPGRKYGSARISHWPTAWDDDELPATIVHNVYGSATDKGVTTEADYDVVSDGSLVVTSAVAPSMSGSPVFSHDGRLVGLVCGDAGDGTLHSGPGAVQLWELFADAGIHLPLGPDSSWTSRARFDFDGDGAGDLLFAQDPYDQPNGATSELSVLRVGSSGSLGAPEVWKTDLGSPGETVLVGNFDGDGDERDDVLRVAERPDGTVYLQLAPSSGSAFGSASIMGSVANARNSLWYAADFTGDGRTDVLRLRDDGTTTSAGLLVSYGTSFGTEVSLSSSLGAREQRFFVGDFDGDRHADVLAAALINGWWYFSVRTTEQDRAGAWYLSSAQLWGGTAATGNDRFLVGNFDGQDGDDLMHLHPYSSAFPLWASGEVFPSTGSDFDTGVDDGLVGLLDSRFLVRDLDGDGDDDVAWAYEAWAYYGSSYPLEDAPIYWYGMLSDLPSTATAWYLGGVSTPYDATSNLSDWLF